MAHQRVRARRDDVAGHERRGLTWADLAGDDSVCCVLPQFDPHPDRLTEAEAPLRLDARAEQREGACLGVGRQRTVGDQHGRLAGILGAGRRLGVERFVLARRCERRAQGLAVLAIDGDHRAVVLTAHEDERDAGTVERETNEQEVFDEGVMRREGCIDEGQ